MKRSEERNCGKGWGGGREALLNHIPFCPNGGQDFSHSSEERPRQQASAFPPQQNPVGRGLAFFFFFLFTVSDGLHITNYSPLLSPNNQLVPKSESPAPFRLSCKMQGRFSPEKAVWLLISGAKLREQPDTFVER